MAFPACLPVVMTLMHRVRERRTSGNDEPLRGPRLQYLLPA
jgi:hypothetical protein